MVDTKISNLPAASAAADANEFAINEAGSSKKLSLAQIETQIMLSPTVYSPIVNSGAFASGTYTYPTQISGNYIYPTEYSGNYFTGIFHYPTLYSGDFNTGVLEHATLYSGTLNNPTIGFLKLQSGTTTIPPLDFVSGELLTVPMNGTMEYDGRNFFNTLEGGWRGYSPTVMWRAITGLSGEPCLGTLGPQPWFPTKGAVTVLSGMRYNFEGALNLSRTSGVISHTTSIAFGGTARATGIGYVGHTKIGDMTTGLAGMFASVSTGALLIKIASIVATEQIQVALKGYAEIVNSGTFIPQFSYSATVTGAPRALAGTYFKIQPVARLTGDYIGDWN